MRWAIVLVAALLAAEVRGADDAADDAAKASATLDGKKMQFPEKGVAGGVRATTALLESCTDKSEGTSADLKKAQEGDHVRLVFAKPIAVIIGGDKLEVTELVFTQPLNTGVFWLRVGDRVVRFTKYRFEKEQNFVAWRNEARVAE
ncbi:MAG: hypothetical protein U0935_25235 [Pirellulales bacterium]